MKIKRLYATFGNLKNAELKLVPGLNIVQAPNEAGKSTWCAFIRTMLYGVNTSVRDKATALSDKTRFRPWSGAGMEGLMDLEANGRNITITRTSLGSVPMKKFKARYTGTNEAVEYLNGENVGEMLTGVSESVFERTAFIRQSGVRISQTSELEKRISSLVSSGDENLSYTEADSALRAWQRKIKFNKTGSLPRLEDELQTAKDKLKSLENAVEGTAELRRELERLKKQEKQYEADIVTHDELDRRSDIKRSWDAKTDAETALKKYETLKDALTINGRMITRDDTAALHEAFASVTPLQSVLERAEKNLAEAKKESESAQSLKTASVFSFLDENAVSEKIKKAEECESKIREAESKRLSKGGKAGLIAAMAAAVIAAVLFLTVFSSIPALIAAAAVFVISGTVLLIKSGKKDDSPQVLEEILQEFKSESVAQLKEKAEEYKTLSKISEEAKIKLNAAEESFKHAEDDLKSTKETALEKIRLIAPGVTDLKTLPDVISRVEALLERLSRAEFERISSQNVYAALLTECGGVLPEKDEDYIAVPLRNRQDTIDALSRVRNHIREISEKYNMAMGEIKSMGDPAVLKSTINRLQQEISEQEQKFDALSIAIDTLKGANLEIQTRFSPIISHNAGKIMRNLTAGRYESLVFDKSFDAMAKTAGEAVGHSVLSLSKGTEDQLYLSLRLAMCEMILTGDEPCPIILDDALVNMDDMRMDAALDILREMAQSRQIILFSCHSREAEHFSDGVNIVKI